MAIRGADTWRRATRGAGSYMMAQFPECFPAEAIAKVSGGIILNCGVWGGKRAARGRPYVSFDSFSPGSQYFARTRHRRPQRSNIRGGDFALCAEHVFLRFILHVGLSLHLFSERGNVGPLKAYETSLCSEDNAEKAQHGV